MKYDLIPTGTMAHEWIMFHAGCFGYKRANYLAMEDWIKVYQGDLGTALIDTYTTNSFLRTLTRQQALLLQGLRQDSGDEIEVGEKIIARYKEFRIDPTTKLIVFSNALDFEKALRVMNYFKGKIKTGFGIGTFITCDPGIVDFVHPNVVMKLSRCRMSPKDPWEDVIKVSGDFGKQMGLKKEFEIAIYQLNLDGSREKE
jgi:nicotinate phosphoribosyltransferase